MMDLNFRSGQDTDIVCTQSTASVSLSQGTQTSHTVCRSHASNSQVSTPGQMLITAAKIGDVSALDILLQHQQGQSENCISQDNLNASLLEACKEGRKFIVQKLVRSGAGVNVRCSKRGTTPLHLAAELGFVDIADFLLNKDADVNADDAYGNSALILSLNRAGSSDILNLLLAYKAEIDHQNSEGDTALMKAVEVMDIDAVRILILAGANLKLKNRKGKTARSIAVRLGIADVFDPIKSEMENRLCYSYLADSKDAISIAALQNHTEAVKILLDCRYLKNEVEFKDLHKSKKDNHNVKIATLIVVIESICSDAKDNKDLDREKFEIVKIILGSGVDVERDTESLLSGAVIDAAQSGVYELVEILCKLGKISANSSTKKHSALMVAAEIGRLDIVELLLNFGADPRDENSRREIALTYALSNGHIKCANALLQKHKPSEHHLLGMAKVAMQKTQPESLEFLACHYNINKISQTLMREAVLSGDSRLVQFLLNHGADINKTCDRDYPALLVALDSFSYKNHNLYGMITFLVESGASVNRTFSKDSPLVVALKKKHHPDVIHYLLNNGADANEKGDNKGITPLTAAITSYPSSPGKEHNDVLEALLKAGANPNRENRNRDTALHLCVLKDDMGSIKQLIDAGADLEARDSNGLTPMLRAAREGQHEAIMLLKDSGADMKAVDKYGQNAVILSLKSSTLDRERKLELVASDKDQVNTQTSGGQTPLILAADSCDLKAIEVLLQAGADPHKVNSKQETALSILLASSIHRRDAILGVKMLITHDALLSLPNHYCLDLYRLIMSDEREIAQLMVTHGMAPTCVDFSRMKTSASKKRLSDSVWRNLSPLAAAVAGNRLAIARYLIANWFLTPADLVGSDQLKDIKNSLKRNRNSENAKFLDEYMSQPMSLMQLSFVSVSSQLGETIGREERVRKIPLPVSLQDKLLFKTENWSMDFTGQRKQNF
ncbi:hypothetical protein RRG08_047514 [Elysia crispata]|uniref:Uncharacterized protein n=1 Tax=Elysia crispata TaxID=231223 RepID=A0AAE0XWY9_9GAST|nr:hypothetical protein RRG08_047514 [Elysia crispata]